MAEVLLPQSPAATTTPTADMRTTTPSPRSPSPVSSPLDSATSTPQSQPPPPARGRSTSASARRRKSQHSRTSRQSSRAQSASPEYPVFASSLPYTLVRDFAFPVSHPLHYGAVLEPSRSASPGSDWNPERRRSDPMDTWNHAPAPHTRWSAGPWGGDGVMYGDPEDEDALAALPSTSFRSTSDAPLDFDDEELAFYKGKHKKSKSYGNIADFERGRRRESGRRSRGDGSDAGIFWFQGQQSDQRRNWGYSGVGDDPNGGRRDSPFATTLPSRSFHHPPSPSSDEPIPLDTEPHMSNSPQRDSMGPEDEELFAGPSLALYSFEPENSNELRLDEGQEIMVSYRHGQGWLVASDPLTGEQGLVPEAYVRLIADMPNYDPERGEFVDLDEFEDIESEAPLDAETEEWSGDVDGLTPNGTNHINDEPALWTGKSRSLEETDDGETMNAQHQTPLSGETDVVS